MYLRHSDIYGAKFLSSTLFGLFSSVGRGKSIYVETVITETGFIRQWGKDRTWLLSYIAHISIKVSCLRWNVPRRSVSATSMPTRSRQRFPIPDLNFRSSVPEDDRVLPLFWVRFLSAKCPCGKMTNGKRVVAKPVNVEEKMRMKRPPPERVPSTRRKIRKKSWGCKFDIWREPIYCLFKTSSPNNRRSLRIKAEIFKISYKTSRSHPKHVYLPAGNGDPLQVSGS